VIGALLPRSPSRSLKRSSSAVDLEASTAKRAAVTATAGKTTPVNRAMSDFVAMDPSAPVSANKQAEKSVTPISHRVLNSGLAYDVLKVGSGALAARGRAVRVRYEGRLATTGQSFDSGEIKFRLGMGEVIRAWDEGIQGMLAGEQRRLYVPARLGYGAAGRPPAIPPGAGLIFEVEVLGC